jgi:tetratricopeptide (TPR) repeat protein
MSASEAGGDKGIDPELREHVDKLLAAGEHAVAAEALMRHGHLADAAVIFEQIFEHDRALELYEQVADARAAMRVALASRDEAAVDRVIVLATRTGQAAGLLKQLERAERYEEMGKIHLGAGELEQAADAFERAGRFARAATCREELGDLRAAGMLYERHLDENPGEPDACLRLGRILARFSRYDDAIELLQLAVKNATSPGMFVRAAPVMILAFLELGYREAAEQIVRRWQRDGGEGAPPSLEGFLASDRGQALAAQMAAPAQAAPARKKKDPEGLDAFFGATPAPSDEGPPATDAGAAGALADVGLEEQARGEDATMLLAGRYLLGEPLGGGGVGQVFRAYDALMDRPVAVKIFGSQAMASEAVQGYGREARAAAALDHYAVAPLVELNMAQGFVVTTFVEAETLEDRLRAGGDNSWLMPFAKALLDLLATCHRVGLVHGALKPTNLFVGSGGLSVVDFGAHHLLALRSTETGGLASVWPYLAPEQLFGARPDVSADLYAVAAILYRGLTGTPPFARAEDDRRSAPRPASTLVDGLDPAWDRFFAKALSPHAEERFASAQHMEDALPALPSRYALPAAVSLAGEDEGPVVTSGAGRYDKGGLVFRDRAGLRVYEGDDRTLRRAVWIVEVDDDALLEPFKASARIGRGVQPVYDVVPEQRRAVIARDAQQRVVDLDKARELPQGLTRDLASVGAALERVHESGFAFGGLSEERLSGPVGPRLRLAPAPALAPASPIAIANDWQDFGRFCATVLGAPEASGLSRTALSEALETQRLLERAEAAALIAEAEQLTWPSYLEQLAERMVKSARGRVMARLAVGILRGGQPGG